jgi:methylated-DNA-[protein]-cysteine S-methyltransferase
MHENLDFDSAGSIDSPVGPISVYAKDGQIIYLRMTKPAEPQLGDNPVVSAALAQLAEYFAGNRQSFDIPIQAHGTEFQRAVWQRIAAVPFGQTISYADIAREIGKPLAARAVGGAVGANPHAIIVPCHRVMGASGRITGFSGGEGIPTKRWLLAHESIESVD